MFYILLIILSIWWKIVRHVNGAEFSVDTFSDDSILVRQGKIHYESLAEKTNVPQFGGCWTNAIKDLQMGCKFLSENIQNELALKFTDCFLQMSGYDPLNCKFSKKTCPQNLSDRAFNAYTEFYTHTHSICYFLQSQTWQEEAEKTVNKLSKTSRQVSHQLREADRIQQKLLTNQKESLFIQQNLLSSSKDIAYALKLSENKIITIISDFQNSTQIQKELLINVFENLLSLKSWVVNEISWFNSLAFFVTVVIISFIFTSVGRTKEARTYVLLIFAINFMLERSITYLIFDYFGNQVNLAETSNILYEWFWLLRKFCMVLSVFTLIYVALNYSDYPLLNYQILLELRDQNLQLLKYFSNSCENCFKSKNYSKRDLLNKSSHSIHNSQFDLFSNLKEYSTDNNSFQYMYDDIDSKDNVNCSMLQSLNTNCLFETQGVDHKDSEKNKKINNKSLDANQSIDDFKLTSEKQNIYKSRIKYNLRSSKIDKEII